MANLKLSNSGGILTMANKYYLCKCNMCDTIMFDENPGENSVLIDITTINKPINHMAQLQDGSEFYWGCPNCITDSYLFDYTELVIINDEF